MPIVPSHIIPTNTAAKVRDFAASCRLIFKPRFTKKNLLRWKLLFVSIVFVCLFVCFCSTQPRLGEVPRITLSLNLLWARVVVRTSNMKVSPLRLADYVKRLRQKACSTIIFPHLTNQISVFWRCLCRQTKMSKWKTHVRRVPQAQKSLSFSSLNMQNCAYKLYERSCLQTCSEDKDVRWFNAAHESILGVKWFTMALK